MKKKTLILAITIVGLLAFIYFFFSYTTDVDCGWQANANAWIDENQNRKWDSNELSLPNVVFRVYDVKSNYTGVVAYGVSVHNGPTSLFVWLSGCPRTKFVIHAEAPENYLHSTPIEVKARQKSNQEYEFGFYYLPELPAPTPRPSGTLDCKAISLIGASQAYITTMAVAPDNSVWVGTNGNGLIRFLPGSEQQNRYDVGSVVVRSIEFDPQGDVWVGTNDGAVLFDGTSWTTYTESDGLAGDIVDDIGIAPDGNIWYATWLDGVSKFTPETNTWETNALSPYKLTSDFGIHTLEFTQNNEAWFVSYYSIYRLTNDFSWEVIKRDQNDEFGGLTQLDKVVLIDQSLWFSGKNEHGPGIAKYELGSKDIITYSHHNTGGAMVGDTISSLAAASDMSLWIGLRTNGLLHFIPQGENNSKDLWLHYTVDNGLNSNNIRYIAVDKDGIVWLLTDDEKISRCNIDE